MRQLDYRLLGPLEVSEGGEALPLGRTQQRAVLALLLLHAGRTVSTDQLIEALWPEKGPAKPQTAIQGYVSGLRKALGAKTIATAAGGYALQVDPESVDAHRFERELRAAREDLGRDSARAAAARLHVALALWRGNALADFTYEPWAQDEIARLEELRLVALEEQAQAELALGGHAELVPKLETLVREHPLRERLRGELILSLYRSGRQAEALEAYQEIRAALVEGLGVDPSPELQTLYKQILNHDPSLAGEALATRPRSNLPNPTTPLLGRTRELGELFALLQAQRLVTLTGPGGIGKTRLALQAAADLADEFRDGVWFVPLATLREPGLMESTIAQTLGLTDTQTLAEQLTDNQQLLVLDNLEQLVDAAPQLGELLSGAPGVKLLATSRAPLRLSGEYEYPLGPLEEADAIELFTERARAAQPSFEPDEHVMEICRRLDNLPLALELAAARVKVLNPDQMLQRAGPSLDLLATGARDAPQRQRTLRATMAWSYALLNEQEQRLFATLAVFAGTFDLEAVEAVCRADLDTVHGLIEKSLLRRTERGRFFLLETIREYALERLDEHERAPDARLRHAQYFLELARDVEPKLDGRDQVLWLSRLDPEHSNFRAALSTFENGDPVRELELATCLWRYFFVRGLLREGFEVVSRALGHNRGQTVARARALVVAGVFATPLELFGEADLLLTEAEELARSLDDSAVLADALNSRGNNRLARGDTAAAIELYEQALGLIRAPGGGTGIACEGDLLSNLGGALSSGDLDQARVRGGEALAWARARNDPQRTAHALGCLAEIEFLAGDLEQSRALSLEAVDLDRELGDLLGTAVDLLRSATAALANGLVDPAALREALELAPRVGSRFLLAAALDSAGSAAAIDDNPERAATIWGAATAIRAAASVPWRGAERQVVEQYQPAVRARLGRERYDAARRHGEAMRADAAVLYALDQFAGEVPARILPPANGAR
ncbi:MAG: hypothetical protein QOE36_405 [Gaiellaceae bacterium]|jgi:predicted ATPase/DNA-binding SARP family transcriptional activator|nr:hypothetical protein [Gaiellaceae bacterium]